MISAAHRRARKFIFDALHLDSRLPKSAAALKMQGEAWGYLLQVAALHRLGPMLAERLQRGDLAAHIPVAVLERLQTARRKHALRNLKIYRELVTVTGLLAAGQIPCIALKGAYLDRFAYPAAGLRPMRDLDLLLRPERAVEAFDLLRAHGYRSLFGGLPQAYFADRIHLPPLTGDAGISVELHHRLTAPDSQQAHPGGFEDKLWARSITKTLGGTEISFPCQEDMLLHLCLHATLDHRLDLGPLALADVAWLVETQQINWPDFLEVALRGNWRRATLPVLFLAKRHLGAHIPDEVVAALGGGEEGGAWLESAEYLLFSDPADHKLLDYDVQEVLYTGKFLERIAKLVGAAFPPRSVIARHFPVSADSPLAYLYYPQRWHRLLTGKLPSLLAAHGGRNQAIRQLALHRKAFGDWLETAGE
jgi:hypothetical protein